MFKKLRNILIFILVLIVAYSLFNIYKTTQGKSIPTTANVSVKDKGKTNVELWNEKVENFKTKINATNKLLVLEGTTDVSAVFDTNESTNSSNMLKWCKAKLSNLDAKSMTVDTKYKFGYSYDLSKVVIEKLDNKIKLTIYQSDLVLEYLQELTENQVIRSEKAMFATQFTPQETTALRERVNTYTNNNIINNTNIRLKAIDSVQTNLLSMAALFNFKDIEIEVVPDGLIESDNSKLNNVKYIGK